MSCRLSPDVHPGVLCLISWLFLTSALATGESVRKSVPGTSRTLTAQETLSPSWPAMAGPTRKSSSCFFPRRTVEWHLRKISTKLGITSRRELYVALAQLGHDARPAQPRA